MTVARRWFVSCLVLLISGLGLWLVPYTGLREWPVLSSIATPDAALASGFAVTAVGAVALAVLKPPLRPLLLVGLVALILGALFGARSLAQGWRNDANPPIAKSVSVVSWNSGNVPTEDVVKELAPVIKANKIDVVILPEVGWLTAVDVGKKLAAHGFLNHTFAPESANTSVIISDRLAALGSYSVDESTPPWAGVTIRPKNISAQTPVIVGVHFQQPAISSTSTWKMHTEWVRKMCSEDQYIAVVGDFNSTLNTLGSGSFPGCRDVASAHGAGAAATWPTSLPPFMGIAIDRFFLGDRYDVDDATFYVDRGLSGSDHWAIIGSIPTGRK